jgi:hypothetical protein
MADCLAGLQDKRQERQGAKIAKKRKNVSSLLGDLGALAVLARALSRATAKMNEWENSRVRCI